jgi:nicotinamidase-related amidase
LKKGFGLDVPGALEEVCAPGRCALLIYDMQAAIVPQIAAGAEIVKGCAALLEAARAAGVRVFFTRHVFLPSKLAGVAQLRRSMIWQHKDEPEETSPFLLPGSAGSQIATELAPREDEGVLDKITMSAFEGTYLDLAMRDAQLTSFVVAGIALEVGIEPTVRHALDKNYIPVLIPELCGSKTEMLHERSLDTLRETGEVVMAGLGEVLAAWGAAGK